MGKKQTQNARTKLLVAEKRLTVLQKHISELEEQLVLQEEALRAAVAGLKTLVPLSPIQYQVPTTSRSAVSAVGLLSDWHIGDKVEPQEVQGYGRFDAATAAERLEVWASVLLDWVLVQRQAYPIHELVLVVLGDLVHGLIHMENLIYAELSPPYSVIEAAKLLGRLIQTVAPHFQSVRVEILNTDNHGRLLPKTMFRGRANWNLMPMVSAMVRTLVQSHQNVTVVEHPVIKADIVIQGKTFLCEHGNDLRSWMGLPYYGIERMKQREADRRSVAGKPPFDYLVVGHFHTPAFWDRIVMNPALTGTTPYDHAVARHAWPGQTAFLVHPKHGLFNYLPIVLWRGDGKDRSGVAA